jgi:hypothetical protein
VRSWRHPIRFSAARTRRAFAEGQELMRQRRIWCSPNRAAAHRGRSGREQFPALPTAPVESLPALYPHTGGCSIPALRQSNGHRFSRSSPIVSFIATAYLPLCGAVASIWRVGLWSSTRTRTWGPCRPEAQIRIGRFPSSWHRRAQLPDAASLATNRCLLVG